MAFAKQILGSIYYAQGVYDKSIATLVEALQHLCDTIGDDNDDVANAQTTLGNAYHRIGEDELAR
jgi:tetratricopeptide (TPR) repeat protein